MHVTALLMQAMAATTLAFPQRRAPAAAQPQDLCGNNQNLIISGTPWIVFNMFYNAARSVGTQCTNYLGQTTSSSGQKQIQWASETNIQRADSTANLPKGYSFVGLTQGLETQLSAIKSIPASYSWTRTNTTAWKGNTCFDFMTSDTKGDSTSTNAQELMLWLQYDGGQLPIGWNSKTPAATIDNLFGTSWKLYEGKNTDTGITVHSLLPDVQFQGSFEGDLKEWLVALAGIGRFSQSTFVNVGNAGTEPFWGNAVMNATLGLQIDL